MAGMDSITKHLQHLALQHSKGSDDPPSDEVGDTGANQLIEEFMTKMTLADTISLNRYEGTDNEEDSELDVDPSQTYSDLSYFALQLNDAALSTHLLAVYIRNWFQQRSMPEYYQVAKKIADALCLRRLDAVVIECQAADQCERKGPDAKTSEEKKRLRKLFVEAEDGLGSLGAVEMDLIEVFNIC